MRVLFITGSYPPEKCGVGDYSYHLAEAISLEKDIEVSVLTSVCSVSNETASKVNVFRHMQNWRNTNLVEIKRVISKFRPDVVHIQYPTQGYFGRPPSLLPLYLRCLGLPVVQTWHEYFYQSGVKWQNLLGCDALVYVRPDFPEKIPFWINKFLGNTPQFYIANTSTIPTISLQTEELHQIKESLSSRKPIVCFFGFAHANKGMELLFDIASPSEHHLVLICDLNINDEYQARILALASQEPWKESVTITGFVPSLRVSEILAVADAVVFPFPNGAGEWNTSLNASQASGSFSLATTEDTGLLGYNEITNTYFSKCGDIDDLKSALRKYIGHRIKPQKKNLWGDIASAHINIYKEVIN